MDPVAGAVGELLAHARGDEATSVFGLVPTIERMRGRPLVIRRHDDLAPGVFGVWRKYPDRDEIHYAPWVAAPDLTIGHEFGHILLGHEGSLSVEDMVRQTLPAEWHEMALSMFRECGQGMSENARLRRIEAEAEAFASELCNRISGADLARSARIRSLLNEAL